MLKEVLASNAAKLVAACVCPVVAGTVALEVPQVRAAVHKATAPKLRTARAKPRIRVPANDAGAQSRLADARLTCAAPPLVFADAALRPASLNLPVSAPAADVPYMGFERGAPSANCATVNFANRGILIGVGGVPEPATWMQLIAGFALAGAALRARRRRCHGEVTSLS
jgi:hypothetical protein